MLNLELNIAKRYLFSKKSTNAINIISLVSAFAMLFGTMALILVLSVFNGLEDLVKSLYNVFYSDVAVFPAKGKTFEITDDLKARLKAIDYIEASSFVLQENALLEYEGNQHICTIKAVDDNYFKVAKGFDTFIVDGKKILYADSINYIIPGVGVAQGLGLNNIMTLNPVGIYMPKKSASNFALLENAFNRNYLTPSAVFAVSDEFDTKYALTSLSFFQNLTENYYRASEIDIRLKNPQLSANAIKSIKNKLGTSFEVKSRYEQNEVLYKILKSEKWVTFSILVFIILIASFNIIGALSMLVLEKKKDIATLTALGFKQRSILKLFLFEGLLMSGLGAICGMILAVILCILQQKIGLIPMPGTSFLVKYYPVKMNFSDFAVVGLVIIAISLIAAWFPAKKAAKSVENEYLTYL